jgi:hypothetical protein
MVGMIVEPCVEVPPVIEQGDEVGYKSARGEGFGSVAIPAPLVLEFVVDVFRIGSFAIEPGNI